MMLDERLASAAHGIADRLSIPDVDLDVVRARARANRRRDLTVAASTALVAITVVAAVLIGGQDPARPLPAEPPTPNPPPHVAVWYDQEGLHHGDQVDQTPVELLPSDDSGGVLALVRGGAVYLDPRRGEVWFHPWDGDPHVIGRGSTTGPGGDPQGDNAAWFEGDQLVVYDTARAKEISRTTEIPVVSYAGRENVRGGNGFMHVSADEVVWIIQNGASDGTSAAGVHRLDLATGTRTVIHDWTEYPPPLGTAGLEDIDGGVRLMSTGIERDGYSGVSMTIETSGGPTMELGDELISGWLSPDGSFVLAPWWTGPDGGEGVAIIDARSGERWDVLGKSSDYYGWIAWSYDDIALIEVDDVVGPGSGDRPLVLACEATTHDCERLTYRGQVLFPTP